MTSTSTRRPVVRENAEQLLLFLLLSFAGSVIVTRAFLSLTGYPQVGGGPLHIAHLLWGGLLLFMAALVMLILANRWAQTAGALLAGSGVGLFIDEVGKFITRSNDYFYPLAAPIIYAFFLITAFIYLRVRRSQARDARDQLYYALQGLGEVLDRDLNPDERTAIEEQLRFAAAQQDQPDLTRLATMLLDYLSSPSLRTVPRQPGLWERLSTAVEAWSARWIRPRWLRPALIVGLTLFGFLTLSEPLATLLSGRATAFSELLSHVATQIGLPTTTAPAWLALRLALEAATGLLLLASAVLLAAGEHDRGLRLGHLGLLLSLTMIDLILFYFDQFATVFAALVQFVLLLGLGYYRRNFEA